MGIMGILQILKHCLRNKNIKQNLVDFKAKVVLVFQLLWRSVGLIKRVLIGFTPVLFISISVKI